MFKDIFEKHGVLNESYIINEEDLYYKFDEWKKGNGKNVLLITGLIGSGKSTLAQVIAYKHGADVISLDGFESCNVQSDKYTKSFFEKNPELMTMCQGSWEGMTSKTYIPIFLKYFEYLIDSLRKDSSKLYVVEGFQLYGYIDNDILIRYPMIIKRTSVLTSTVRWIQRNNYSESFIRNLLTELKADGLTHILNDIKDEKFLMRSLRNDIKRSQG